MKKKKYKALTSTSLVSIDAANMFYAQKTIGFRVDYIKFARYLKKEFNAKYFLYYTGFDPKNHKQIKFLDKIESFGYRTIRKPIKRINSKAKIIDKANLDVELAIDTILSLKKYKNFVLISGDSDFAYLLKVLKKLNRRVFVISARGHISKELIQEAEKYIPLESLKKDIEAVDKKSPRTRRGKLS